MLQFEKNIEMNATYAFFSPLLGKRKQAFPSKWKYL